MKQVREFVKKYIFVIVVVLCLLINIFLIVRIVHYYGASKEDYMTIGDDHDGAVGDYTNDGMSITDDEATVVLE